MNLYFTGDTKGLYRGIRIILKDLEIKNSKDGMEVLCRKGNCLSVTKKDGKALIVYSEKAEFFRGLSYLLSRDKDFSVEEKKVFTKNGAMLDCSRNAVLSLDTVKYFLRKMALMGLNLCMLYTEDTYAIEGEPYFGYLRGRYSFEELKEIDDYAYALGIEAIPCIQTLSHLERA
ncbi:MAG: beta-N-acetylhexosaminidase, partial [Clostridia bacterium]|nr:beta-N-acetylhexosaminidase [Clostridia bacterium]